MDLLIIKKKTVDGPPPHHWELQQYSGIRKAKLQEVGSQVRYCSNLLSSVFEISSAMGAYL